MEAAGFSKLLADAVTSVQWSYAIYWCFSPSQTGVLEWGDGYYNGDIKTRKTLHQSAEHETERDNIGFQRSRQLRELYESLSTNETTSSQARRPSASLSPEDLSETEWYYLVSMSFVFKTDQGLPARTLARGEPIWLANAHCADINVFTRSLLAKSASIKTVVCFPFLDGVVELGVTELVYEDPDFIQRVRNSLSIPENFRGRIGNTGHEDLAIAMLHHDIVETKPILSEQVVELNSPSNGVENTNQQVEDPTEDELSNCVSQHMSCSDCISHIIIDDVDPRPMMISSYPVDTRLTDDTVHYQSVLSALLKTSDPLVLGPSGRNSLPGSSFIKWRKTDYAKSKGGNEQQVMKKILIDVPRMHGSNRLERLEEIPVSRRTRRGKLNDKFAALRATIPSVNKVDKVSILDDTITQLQELERRVEELETITKRKKSLLNKRKVSEVEEESEEEEEIIVSVNEKDVVVIKMNCPWREGLLLEMMDAITHLHLDTHSVQSSTVDGILSMTIKTQIKPAMVASAVVSPSIIKEQLERVVQGKRPMSSVRS